MEKGISVARNKIFFFLFVLLSTWAQAVEVIFPQEELPNESFPPQLDSPQVVVSRKIVFQNRFQPAIAYGWLLDEPFYQNAYVSAGLSFSWNEFNSVSLRYLNWKKGLSEYSNQFARTNTSLQFGRAQGPENGLSLAFNNRFLYGKVSFSKVKIIPTTVSAICEIGMIKYGSQSLPLVGVGLSNGWYLTKNWSLDLSLRLYLRQALDPLSADLRSASTAPPESSFATTTRLSTSFDFGAQYLF